MENYSRFDIEALNTLVSMAHWFLISVVVVTTGIALYFRVTTKRNSK